MYNVYQCFITLEILQSRSRSRIASS